MKDLSFRFEENGEEYKVLKILCPKEFQYQYIIYTADNINYYASRYKVIDGKLELSSVEEEYEWEYIQNNMPEVIKNAN